MVIVPPNLLHCAGKPPPSISKSPFASNPPKPESAAPSAGVAVAVPVGVGFGVFVAARGLGVLVAFGVVVGRGVFVGVGERVAVVVTVAVPVADEVVAVGVALVPAVAVAGFTVLVAVAWAVGVAVGAIVGVTVGGGVPCSNEAASTNAESGPDVLLTATEKVAYSAPGGALPATESATKAPGVMATVVTIGRPVGMNPASEKASVKVAVAVLSAAAT